MSFKCQQKKDLWIHFALELTEIAKAVSLKHFRRASLLKEYERKEDLSLISPADREIEEKMRRAIERRFPHHGILGEEGGFKKGVSDLTWILDPIDGTLAFACGKTEFVSLIALVNSTSFLLGVIYQPFTQECWLGVRGQPSLYNSKACVSTNVQILSQARLGSTYPFFYEPRLKNMTSRIKQSFFKLIHKAGAVSFGGNGYGYALLASGHMEIFLDPALSLCDYAALIPVLEGAGAVLSDWSGKPLSPTPLDLEKTSSFLACSTHQLKTQVLDVLKTCRQR